MPHLSDEDLRAAFVVGQHLGCRLPAINLHDLPPNFPRRKEILMTLEALEPIAFARMSVTSESGPGGSIEAEMAKRGLAPMSKAAHAELMATDPGYREQQQQQALDQEQQKLKSLEEQAAAAARRNAILRQGSEAAADRAMAAEKAQAEAKAAQAERDRQADIEFNQRLARKQAEIRRQLEIARAHSATDIASAERLVFLLPGNQRARATGRSMRSPRWRWQKWWACRMHRSLPMRST